MEYQYFSIEVFSIEEGANILDMKKGSDIIYAKIYDGNTYFIYYYRI